MFEDFLKDKHSEDYMGTDDDMPDSFEHWLSNLQVDELIEFADEAIVKLAPKVLGQNSAKKRDTSSDTMRELVNKRWNENNKTT